MPSYLIKRHQTYFVNVQIPQTLRKKLGRSSFTKSLGTRDPAVAERLKHTHVGEYLSLIEEAKSSSNSSELKQALAEVRISKLPRSAKEDIALDVSNSDTLLEAIEVAYGDKVYLAEHIDTYLSSQSLQSKTLAEKLRFLNTFCDKFQFSSDVSKQELQRWADTLLQDKNRATVYKIISSCRVFWHWIERAKGLDLGDPFRNALTKPKKKTKADLEKDRKAFSAEEINSLILYSDGTLNDLIRLASYSGCRIQELCSLRLDHVYNDYFVVENAKTAAGNRQIPIHSSIKKLVLKLINSSEDGFLLSGLSSDKYGNRSANISKKFGRFKTKLGYDHRYVFHSIRKTFISRLESAGVPELLAARLCGHEIKTLSYGLYSTGSTFDQLRNAIENVNYH